MSFKVRLAREAEADLDRLFDFVLRRELARGAGDLQLAEQALAALRAEGGQEPVPARAGDPVRTIGLRRAVRNRDPSNVVVLAIRHQLEDDYH